MKISKANGENNGGVMAAASWQLALAKYQLAGGQLSAIIESFFGSHAISMKKYRRRLVEAGCRGRSAESAAAGCGS
jgi:hypothetical protein